MNSELYKKYLELDIDTSLFNLEKGDYPEYFCTPVGAEVIGWEGIDGIHYCFIPGFGEMVFAVSPMKCDCNVFPLAKNFADFLGLILATKSVTVLEQIISWDKQTYLDYINEPDNIKHFSRPELIAALAQMSEKLAEEPIEEPFEYVKAVQADVDYSKIPFSDEYYDVTGLER